VGIEEMSIVLATIGNRHGHDGASAEQDEQEQGGVFAVREGEGEAGGTADET